VSAVECKKRKNRTGSMSDGKRQGARMATRNEVGTASGFDYLIRSRGAKPIFTMQMSNTNTTALTISFSGCGGLKLNQDICLPVFKVLGACNQRIAKGPRDES
jgi:hypothetical protein